MPLDIAPATDLPEACITAAAMGYGKAMEDMHGPMMMPDPDLAFACGMIPHH